MSALRAALTPPPPRGRARDSRCRALCEAARTLIVEGDWPALLELRAWAWQHPLFATPDAALRGFLRQWEQALLSAAPLATAAALVRDDVATAVQAPWERLAARASWAELRPLLQDDQAAWSVAEARVLRGETLPGRSPFSGMPLRRPAWEPAPVLPTYGPWGAAWGSPGFAAPMTRVSPGPGSAECLVCEPEWAALLAVWSWGEASVVKVAGTGLQALATAGATDSIWVGPCTTKEALAAMMHMHGGPAPFTEERGMVAARRAVWRLLTALTGESWPNSGSRLQAAMRGWKWARYGPEEPDADQALFLVLEDPRRGVAWATSAWVTD